MVTVVVMTLSTHSLVSHDDGQQRGSALAFLASLHLVFLPASLVYIFHLQPIIICCLLLADQAATSDKPIH